MNISLADFLKDYDFNLALLQESLEEELTAYKNRPRKNGKSAGPNNGLSEAIKHVELLNKVLKENESTEAATFIEEFLEQGGNLDLLIEGLNALFILPKSPDPPGDTAQAHQERILKKSKMMRIQLLLFILTKPDTFNS